MTKCTHQLALPTLAVRTAAIAVIAFLAAPARSTAQKLAQATFPVAPAASEQLDALEAAGDYHALMKELHVPDRPELPQMFLCGDSISQHNAPWVKVALNGKFNVTHWLDLPTRYPQIVPKTSYSGTSALLIEMLSTVLSSKDYQPTYLVLNAGLHDATYDVPVEQYRANLVKVVEMAEQHRAKTVWMLTTARTKGHPHNPRIDAYNVAAREVMNERDVPVIDLHRFAVDAVNKDGESATYNGDDVHYALPVRKRMGAFLGAELAKIFRQELAAASQAAGANR